MALKDFFTEQIDLLKWFLLDVDRRAHGIRVSPDLKLLLMKLLGGLDGDDSFPHVLLCIETPFENPRQYCAALLAQLTAELELWSPKMQQIGYQPPQRPEGFDRLPVEWQLVRYGSLFAESLPDAIGSIVLLLVPDQVADAAAFRGTLAFLADETTSPWFKYLVIDDRKAPALEKVEARNPFFQHQVFHLSPEDIERRTKLDLGLNPALTAEEKRQYTALLASFACARREYDEALRLQQQVAEMLTPDVPAGERASALHNLGNTHLARKQLEQAEATYGQVLQIALDHDLTVLVAMILTNLGVALYRQGQHEQAIRSFEVARQTCQSANLKPVEAHVLDNLAKTYEADGKLVEAEGTWRAALAVYGDITSSTFAEGRADAETPLRESLERVAAASQRLEEAKAVTVKAGWFSWAKGA
ncbi:MAG: tetratricopeptide repeat protein [Planctomycetia bacterium]|nr:tetratricopeptide repeat protein [Planctomycetia bacterium]